MRVLVAVLVSLAVVNALQCGPGTEEVDGFCVLPTVKYTEILEQDNGVLITAPKSIVGVNADGTTTSSDDVPTSSDILGIKLELAYHQGGDIGAKSVKAAMDAVTSSLLDTEEKREQLSEKFEEMMESNSNAIEAALAGINQQLKLMTDIAVASGGSSPFWVDVVPTYGYNKEEVPANANTKLQLVGKNFEKIYHPKAEEVYDCVFTALEEEDLTVISHGMVMESDGFYFLVCDNPLIFYAGPYQVTAIFNNEAVAFSGSDSNDVVTFLLYVQSTGLEGSNVAFKVVGANLESNYTCKYSAEGDYSAEKLANFEGGKYYCPIPTDIEYVDQHIMFSVGLVTPEGNMISGAENVDFDFNVSSCENGLKDHAETDVDCGGDTCDSCAAGKACLSNDDCDSGLPCTAGVCSFPTDPICRSNNWAVNSDSNRRISQRQGYFCDRGGMFNGQWIKFNVGNGKMPHSRTPEYACSTHASGWINGGVPTVADGVVSRQVCFAWAGRPCYWNQNMQMVNCHDFFLYKLPEPLGCSFRYCVED